MNLIYIERSVVEQLKLPGSSDAVRLKYWQADGLKEDLQLDKGAEVLGIICVECQSSWWQRLLW